MLAADVAVVLRPDAAAGVCLNAAAVGDPAGAQTRQTVLHIDAGASIRVRTGGIIGAERRLTLAERDLAEGHPDIGVVRRRAINLGTGADRPGGDLRDHQVLTAGHLVHGSALLSTALSAPIPTATQAQALARHILRRLTRGAWGAVSGKDVRPFAGMTRIRF